MSQPDSIDPAAKKRFDIYSVMLAVALVNLIAAVTLLAMELNRYQWDLKAATAPRAQLQQPIHAPMTPHLT